MASEEIDPERPAARPRDERPAARPISPPPAPGTPEGDALRPPAKGLGCFGIGCIGIVGLIVVGMVIVFVVGLNSNRDSPSNRGYEARIYCENAVKERLKAPSTAEFSTSHSGANPYTVSGTVDAENSFGGTVRNTFACTVTFSGDTYSVSVDSLS